MMGKQFAQGPVKPMIAGRTAERGCPAPPVGAGGGDLCRKCGRLDDRLLSARGQGVNEMVQEVHEVPFGTVKIEPGQEQVLLSRFPC